MKQWLYLILHDIPGLSNTLVSSGIISLLCLEHVLSQDDIHIISKSVSSNASSHFADEDESQQEWKLENEKIRDQL